ncbi:MAG: 3-demethylubiquinone-9 3-O-methyltransferase [Microgenomates group bacterium GW2011_GWC1_43_13]|nr:MAG: 3-demethylubiquinone-9 3-O-methyltransferase [Microgenomates group bacterium GW2011_GWC1_43_13]
MKKKIKATKRELFYNDFSDTWGTKINNSETNKRLCVVFEKLLHPRDLKGKSFLDTGCGLGYFSEKANKLGAKVTAVDIGENLVDITRKRVKKGNFKTASASDLPFRDEVFDVILSTEVVEHVENPQKALKEAVRVLKKNGVLVITTPNRLFKPFFDFLSFVGLRPYHGNENWMYSWDMKKIMTRYGLINEKEIYFNFIAPNQYLDSFERIGILKHLMINYGIRFVKK